MKKMVILGVALSGLMLSQAGMAAGDAAAGKDKSQACVGCHGMNGKSNNPQYPNLAGQKRLYLISALKAYKDGSRKNAMMSSFASSLSDQDIEDLAAYYSSVK